MEALFYEELLQGGIAWTRTLSLDSLGSALGVLVCWNFGRVFPSEASESP